MINNKKGMQIAINTVVGLILGGLMLMGGFVLLGNIVGKTNNLHEQVNAQMEEDIINAFSSNEPIYIHKNPVSPKKSEDVRFGIGIFNMFNVSRNFKIDIEPQQYAPSSDSQIAYFSDYTISAKEKEVAIILVPTKHLTKGQHALILNVTYDNGTEFVQYDTPKLLYINK